MNRWQMALLGGAVITMILSTRLNRAALWIFAGGVSFILSTAYARHGLPYPPFATMMCDAGVCLAIYFLADRQWEIWLFRIFQASVLVSLCYLTGLIGPHYWYITILEVLNWLALVLIAGTAILQFKGVEGNAWGSHRNRDRDISGAYPALFAPRKDNPFHRKN